MKLKDMLAAIVFSAVLLGPAMLVLAESAAGDGIPRWLTVQDAQFLSGGVVQSGLGDRLDWESFEGGELQEAFEAEVGNHIPAKACALLGNAGWQRMAIELANTPFDYGCYPTFFDSTVLYTPAEDALAAMPAIAFDKHRDSYGDFASCLDDLAKSYPSVQFVVYVAEDSATSPSNPASGYVSNVYTAGDVVSAMNSQLEAGNVTALCDEHVFLEDFYRDYYRSDHHWNIRGALRAYDTIARKLQWPVFPDCEVTSVVGPAYHGYRSRGGLCILDDQPIDVDYPFPGFSYQRDGVPVLANEHPEYYGMDSKGKEWAFYDAFYSNIVHASGGGGGKALIVGDSFADSAKRPIGMQFESIDATREIHSTFRSDDSTLRSHLDDGGYDVVIFMAQCSNYRTLLKRCPNFLK